MSRRHSAVPPPVTAVLDAASAWLPTRLGAVETRLREVTQGHGATLERDASATLLAGGKRLRPLLVLLCGGAGGGDAAVRAASAVELVHMATLVHDDVLDDAPLRRGRPTVAATSGRAQATATGDLLFSRAFAILAEAGDTAQVALLSEASVALAQGELAQRHDEYDTSITAERYMQRCRLKTGRLFECACLMGWTARAGAAAQSGPNGAAGEGALRAFGSEIGLAFQLLDDVLDVNGPAERTGKARGTDLLDGTVTLPLIVAMQRDPVLAEVELRGLDEAGAERICDRIAATGALEEVRSRALEMVAAAKRSLLGPSFDQEQSSLLEMVADGIVDRYG
ncbi:MAG: polyprenyl synthetase family protein [Actinomycetota bacterium]|nr:polyprenyl synthetase family protein [Actinomycetota bacterium]